MSPQPTLSDRVPFTPGPERMRALSLLAASTLFMEALDGTIIAIALPDMARAFHVGLATMGTGITVYLVALAILLPLSAWAADRYGSRAIFTGALLLFMLSSLACALSTTLLAFVIARAAQGGAAALMTPVGRVVVLRHTGRNAMIKTVALLTWPALIAPAIAPPLGGLIVQYLDWSWIFFLNLPLGLAAIIAARRLMPRKAEEDRRRTVTLDGVGFALWAICAVLGIGALESAAHLPAAALFAMIAGAAVCASLALRHYRRYRQPLFDMALIGRHASFRAVILEGSAFRAAIAAYAFLVPLYLHVGIGLPIAKTGFLVMVGMLGNIAMKMVTSPLLRRFGFRRILIGNGLLLGLSFAAITATGLAAPAALLAALLILSGLCRSMQFTALNTLAFADIAPEETSAANSLLSTGLQLNSAMGVAGASLALQIGGKVAGSASLAAFHLAFGLTALTCAGAALSCLRLAPATGGGLMRPIVKDLP